MTSPNIISTDSLKAYQRCMSCIQEFLRAFRVKGTEVWFGEVCFGSPEEPWLRVPMQEDSAELLRHWIDLAGHLVAKVIHSLRDSVETSRRVIKELDGTVVDNAELAAIVDRINFLERLLSELSEVTTKNSVKFHPAVLIKWRDILERSFGPGDPGIRVRVEIVYVL